MPIKRRWTVDSPMSVKPSDRAIYALILGLALTGFVVVLIATRWGIGASPDSVRYLVGARNLLAGDGFSMPAADGSYQAITHFPPLYSMVLYLTGSIGVELMEGARWVNGLLFALNILLVGILLYQLIRRRASNAAWLAVLGALCMLVAPLMLEIHVMAWSEAFYLLLSLSGLMLLAGYLDHARKALLLASAILTGLSLLTRYAGLAVLATGIFGLLLFGDQSFRKRLVDCAIFTVISAVPMALWLLRNLNSTGSATSRELAFHPAGKEHALQALTTLSSWFLVPETAPGAIKLLLLGIIAAGLLAMFYASRGGAADPSIHAPSRPNRPVENIIKLLVAYIFVYVAFLIVSISFIDANTPLDGRILSPIFVCGLILLIYGLALWIVHMNASRLVVYGLVATGVVLLAGYLLRDIPLVTEGFQQGIGFNSLGWRGSGTVARLSDLPANQVLYTNVPEVIYLYTSRGAASLPRKEILTTQQPNTAYGEEMERARDALARGEAAVVYFTIPARSSPAEESELVDALGLCLLARTGDGAIFVGDNGQSACEGQ